MKRLTLRIIFTALFLLLCTLAVQAGTIQLPATGQTTSYATGDDGDVPRGTAWPVPRFTANNGTVTDNLTGLIWLQNANCTDTVGSIVKSGSGGTLNWQDALTWSNALANGNCGLSDGSVAGSWRLPNRKELMSLTDLQNTSPALPTGHPFTGVQSNVYWSSSSYAYSADHAWFVDMYVGVVGGYTDFSRKGNGNAYVWPVRAGQ